MNHLLPAQYLDERTGRNRDADVGGHYLQRRPQLSDIYRSVGSRAVGDHLPLHVVSSQSLAHFGVDRIFRHRNTDGLGVELNQVERVVDTRFRQPHNGQVKFTVEQVRDRVSELRGLHSSVDGMALETPQPLVRFHSGDETQAQHGGNATVAGVTDNNTLEPSGRAMKAETAAKKLGIFLPATPQEFRDNAVTHGELRDLQNNPPEWLEKLRLEGPHPRPVVAQKLGITIAALKRSELEQPMTTAQIKELLADQPEWLRTARTQLAEQRKAEGVPSAQDDQG